MQIKLSIHSVTGKPAKGSVLYTTLGDNWLTATVNLDLAWQLITELGHATSSALTDTRRHQRAFESRQLFMIDIDNDPERVDQPKMQITELAQHEFYQQWGYGYYTSPTHSREQHKFRVCFVTEQPITDYHRAEMFIQALMDEFPARDDACSDPVRLFFGTKNCQRQECLGNIIPQSLVDSMIQQQQALAPAPVVADTRPHSPPSLEELGRILDAYARLHPDLGYELRSRVTWCVARLAGSDAVQMMRSRWPDNHKTRKYESLVREASKPYSGRPYTQASMIKEIRQHDPDWSLHSNSARALFNTRTIKNDRT
jgi:hypothetical protein